MSDLIRKPEVIVARKSYLKTAFCVCKWVQVLTPRSEKKKEKNLIMQVNLPVSDLPFLRRGVSGAWGGNVYKGIGLFLHRGL